MRRRIVLAALAGAPLARAQESEVQRALRAGGVVIALRHALAPGNFDPPEFRIDDCRTQRNLNDAGRQQARRLGRWFAAAGLKPARVRSSPWCRCLETASLAFGPPEAWPALGSPRGAGGDAGPAARAEQLAELRGALAALRARPGFEAWVTHMFLLSDLAGAPTAPGEGLVLRATADGRAEVVARLTLP